jgi:hypothetical protein
VRALGGYRQGDFPEDYDLWLRIHSMGGRLAKVPATVVHMRDRPERLTRTDPRYRRDAFRHCKLAWLQRTILPARVALIGAGREGTWWHRALREHVVGFVDVAPRRIGTLRHGVPIVAHQDIGTLGADVVLATAGSRGARANVRRLMATERWVEGESWWSLC